MSRRVGLRCISAVAGKIKKLFPPAWGYDNPVGKIFCIEFGGYDNPVGKIFGMELGAYDNR